MLHFNIIMNDTAVSFSLYKRLIISKHNKWYVHSKKNVSASLVEVLRYTLLQALYVAASKSPLLVLLITPCKSIDVPVHLTVAAACKPGVKEVRWHQIWHLTTPKTPFASPRRGGEWRRHLSNMMGRLSKTRRCVVRDACFSLPVCVLLLGTKGQTSVSSRLELLDTGAKTVAQHR